MSPRSRLALAVQIALLRGLHALVLGLDRTLGTPSRAWRSAGTAALALVLGLGFGRLAPGCGRGRSLRIGTYNIRRFGVEKTDMARLTELVRGTDADVLAVQEIQSVTRLEELVSRLSTGGRRFRSVLASCGGRSEMFVGFVYDETRARLVETREYAELDPDGKGRCTEGDRAGLLGVFEARGRRVSLLTVHLASGSDDDRVQQRRAQWKRAIGLVARLRSEGAGEVALLGDVNSTGYLDNANGERSYIRQITAEAGLGVLSDPLGCSEYWGPRSGAMEPSLLDHVVTTPGLGKKGSIEVHGFCKAMGCQPFPPSERPPEYTRVSDHCPVTFDLR